MPLVVRQKGYRFLFFSNEGDPREPVHIHVLKDDAIAKFWLLPEVALAENHGFKPPQLRTIFAIVEQNAERMIEAWHDHFGD